MGWSDALEMVRGVRGDRSYTTAHLTPEKMLRTDDRRIHIVSISADLSLQQLSSQEAKSLADSEDWSQD
jgi:hypothetical protein